MKAFGIISVVVLLVLGCISCERFAPAEEAVISVSFECCKVTKSLDGHESNVVSLDLLAFSQVTGMLEHHWRNTGCLSISGKLVSGRSYDWHIVANAPEGVFSGVYSRSSFLSSLTFLFDTGESSFVMEQGGSIVVGDSAEAVPVILDRYACKVSIRNLDFEWNDVFGPDVSVSVGRVMLINVCGSTPYSGVPAAGDIWYNRMGYEAGAPGVIPEATVTDCNISVPGTGTVELNRSFYCLPNPTDNGVNSKNTPEWSPRNTRLVVELLINGVSDWYPIDLPAMGCNCHYVVESLTITGPGAVGPDYPVERSEVSVTLYVVPWYESEVTLIFT